MFIRKKLRSTGKTSVQIVKAVREGDNVSQRIVRHVGQGVDAYEIEELCKLAEKIIIEIENKKNPILPMFEPEKYYSLKQRAKNIEGVVDLSDLREEQRIIDGIHDVFGKLYEDLGFLSLIESERKQEQWNDILKQIVLGRLADPCSKRGTAGLLETDYGISLDLDKIYRMLDNLHPNIDKLKKSVLDNTLSLFPDGISVMFFDVTTLYFESVKSDELKDFGYGKDGKFNEVQVMLSLVTTKEGLPLHYDLFSGKTYEGHTLVKAILSLKEKFNSDDITLVADRAMFTEDNLLLMEKEKIKYIVAAKLKTLPKSKQSEFLVSSDDFKAGLIKEELYWSKDLKHKNRRLIVSYSKARAVKDSKDRERLIDRLLKKVKNGKLKVKDLISNHGSKKYVTIKNNTAVEINENKISLDSLWDGFHGVITNISKDSQDSFDILSRYRDLWQIEEAFRINKHDLKMRPIYHYTPKRIESHIALCFLAFCLVKQSLYRLKIQKKIDISFGRLRNELLSTQSSILLDIKTRKKYIMPSKSTNVQKDIYKAFGLTRTSTPMALQ